MCLVRNSQILSTFITQDSPIKRPVYGTEGLCQPPRENQPEKDIDLVISFTAYTQSKYVDQRFMNGGDIFYNPSTV